MNANANAASPMRLLSAKPPIAMIITYRMMRIQYSEGLLLLGANSQVSTTTVYDRSPALFTGSDATAAAGAAFVTAVANAATSSEVVASQAVRRSEAPRIEGSKSHAAVPVGPLG